MIRSGSLEIDPDPTFRDAPCTRVDPDLFFPDPRSKARPAKRVCGTCPDLVRLACLRYALSGDIPGVWGGTTRKERARMREGARDE